MSDEWKANSDVDPPFVFPERHNLNDFTVAGFRFRPKDNFERTRLIAVLKIVYDIGRKDFKREFRQLIGAIYNEND